MPEILEVTAPQSPVVETDLERRARVLEAAALEIEVRGWTRRAYCDHVTGGVCGRGAIIAALGFDPAELSMTVFQDWDYAACTAFGYEATSIPRFDDADDTTAEDVTFLLRWRAQELRDGWDA